MEPCFPGPLVSGHIVSKWTGQSTIICYITPSTHHCQISSSLPGRHLPLNPKVLGFLAYLVVLSAGQTALASIVGQSGVTWYHLPVLLFRAPYLHHLIQIIFKNQPNCHTDFFPQPCGFPPTPDPSVWEFGIFWDPGSPNPPPPSAELGAVFWVCP